MGSRGDDCGPLRPDLAFDRRRDPSAHCRRGPASGSHHRRQRDGRSHPARHAARLLPAAVNILADFADRRHCALRYTGWGRHCAAACAPGRSKYDAIPVRVLCLARDHRTDPCRARPGVGTAVRDRSRARPIPWRIGARRSFRRHAGPALCRNHRAHGHGAPSS